MSLIPTYHIVVLGTGGVGKSSLVLRFTADEFVDEYDPTIEDKYRDHVYTVDGRGVKLDLTDTAGQEEYHCLHEQWIMEGDAFMVVFSVTDQNSLAEANLVHETIQDIRPDDDFPVVLVGNKVDLYKEQKVSADDARKIANNWNAPLFLTSAKENVQVEEAFFELVREIRKKGVMPRKGSQFQSAGMSPDDDNGSNDCCTIL